MTFNNRLARLKHLNDLIQAAQAQLPVVKLEQRDLAQVITIVQVGTDRLSTTISSHEGGTRELPQALSLEEALARLMDTFAPAPPADGFTHAADPWLSVQLVPTDA